MILKTAQVSMMGPWDIIPVNLSKFMGFILFFCVLELPHISIGVYVNAFKWSHQRDPVQQVKSSFYLLFECAQKHTIHNLLVIK